MWLQSWLPNDIIIQCGKIQALILFRHRIIVENTYFSEKEICTMHNSIKLNFHFLKKFYFLSLESKKKGWSGWAENQASMFTTTEVPGIHGADDSPEFCRRLSHQCVTELDCACIQRLDYIDWERNQPKSRIMSFFWISTLFQVSKHWTIVNYFSRHVNRELDWK